MKRLALIACLLGVIGACVASAGAETARTATVARHCGSFKFGTDGFRPGPSGDGN